MSLLLPWVQTKPLSVVVLLVHASPLYTEHQEKLTLLWFCPPDRAAPAALPVQSSLPGELTQGCWSFLLLSLSVTYIEPLLTSLCCNIRHMVTNCINNLVLNLNHQKQRQSIRLKTIASSDYKFLYTLISRKLFLKELGTFINFYFNAAYQER